MMGVEVIVKSVTQNQPSLLGRLMAANHMGYLDVLALASTYPCLFITSVEVREMPFLGLLTRMGGCLYVERRSKNGLPQEVQEITEALRAGHSVLFFPEATSTNADEVLRFRRPLFQAAIDSSCPVQPLTLNYVSVSYEPFRRSNRDVVCWYGNMSFLPHLLKLFSQTEVTCMITEHEMICSENRSKEELAEESHQQVKDHFIRFDENNSWIVSSKRSFSKSFTRDSSDSTVSPA
jgi:1-acyl-sn-glycerol-3-phosphate acyltransferase